MGEKVIDVLDDVMGRICNGYCKFPDILDEDALNAKCDGCPFEQIG